MSCGKHERPILQGDITGELLEFKEIKSTLKVFQMRGILSPWLLTLKNINYKNYIIFIIFIKLFNMTFFLRHSVVSIFCCLPLHTHSQPYLDFHLIFLIFWQS